MTNTYPGGKARLYQWLINRIPPHETYIATHLGHDAILRYKRPARVNVGIDLDEQVIEWWNRQKNRGTPAFTVIHGDAQEWLQGRTWTGGEFVYSDPPYLFHTRKRRHRDLYKFEYTIAQHVDLLLLLRRLPCLVMISGYPSPLYDDLLDGWYKETIQTTTRGGTPATEAVWMNYPPPVTLHDYSYLGDDFRQRERIKRLQSRWVRRWQAMDRLQRQAVLAAIQEN